MTYCMYIVFCVILILMFLFYHHEITVTINNDLDGKEHDVLWAEQYDKSDMYDDMMTHEQIQQMFSEESDDDEFLGF